MKLEVLEFMLDGNSYGINVAKIREIITYQPVTPVPNSHPSIEGIFMPRDRMITAIDLKNCLQRGVSEPVVSLLLRTSTSWISHFMLTL